MSPARRRALVRFAEQTSAVLVEDDYDGEFRYDGSPIEALRSHSSSGHVCYVGSFSKSMFPSLRLGFIVPPAWTLPALVAAKNSTDWHCSIPIQAAVARFILDGPLLGTLDASAGFIASAGSFCSTCSKSASARY